MPAAKNVEPGRLIALPSRKAPMTIWKYRNTDWRSDRRWGANSLQPKQERQDDLD